MRADPFACTWLIESEDRTPRLVLEVNRNHWNPQRVPRLERVVFRNDLSPADALERCLSGEGEVDIVTEVSPADAERVKASPYATLQAYDANRVLVGIVNRYASDVPLRDVRARQALNLAVDVSKVIAEGLAGYATPLAALTPPWCSGFPAGQQPYPYDAGQARSLMSAAGWPQGRPLRLATPGGFAGIARLVAAAPGCGIGFHRLGFSLTGPASYRLTRLRSARRKVPPQTAHRGAAAAAYS